MLRQPVVELFCFGTKVLLHVKMFFAAVDSVAEEVGAVSGCIATGSKVQVQYL